MNGNDGDLEGEGPTEEELVDADSDSESDAILHEQKESPEPRDNI